MSNQELEAIICRFIADVDVNEIPNLNNLKPIADFFKTIYIQTIEDERRGFDNIQPMPDVGEELREQLKLLALENSRLSAENRRLEINNKELMNTLEAVAGAHPYDVMSDIRREVWSKLKLKYKPQRKANRPIDVPRLLLLHQLAQQYNDLPPWKKRLSIRAFLKQEILADYDKAKQRISEDELAKKVNQFSKELSHKKLITKSKQ